MSKQVSQRGSNLDLPIAAAVLDVLGQIGQTQGFGQRGVQEVLRLRKLSEKIRTTCTQMTLSEK